MITRKHYKKKNNNRGMQFLAMQVNSCQDYVQLAFCNGQSPFLVKVISQTLTYFARFVSQNPFFIQVKNKIK